MMQLQLCSRLEIFRTFCICPAFGILATCSKYFEGYRTVISRPVEVAEEFV